MAVTLAPKAAAAVYRYRWFVPLAEGDGIVSADITATDVTLDEYDFDNEAVTLKFSGGTSGTTGAIAVTVTTSYGETIPETFYLPIYGSATNALNTGQDVCNYALRKIVGMGETATAEELTDALERLNDLLASWAAQGADVGTTFPILASTVLYVPDAFLGAIKANLLLAVHDHYGEPVTALQVETARRGVQLVKNAMLPQDREAEDYY